MKINSFALLILAILIMPDDMPLSAQDSTAYAAIRARELAVFTKNVQDADYYILEEKSSIEIIDDAASYMWFRFDKDLRVKIQTRKGIEKMSVIHLPEPYDPSYIAHFPPIRNYQQLFSRMKGIQLSAMVTRSDGTTQNITPLPDIREDSIMMLEEEYFGTYKIYTYELKGIKIGDVIHIRYSYEVPNIDNMAQLMSFRHFFHSEAPKLRSEFSLVHHKELFLEINYLNGAEPDTIYISDKKKHYDWSFDGLSGCLLEPGTRAYKELPHIVFTAKPYDFWYYTVPKSFEPRFIPNYVVMAGFREERHGAITLSSAQEVNTPQYIQIREFVEKQAQGLDNEKDKTEIMKRVHHTIVDEFDYKNNIEFMIREDIRDPKIGDQIGARTLRDLARNDLYLALILAQDLSYCSTYLSDNRSGEMSEYYFAPIRDNDFLYTVFYGGDTVHWYYPKRNHFGYYQDEIPFYYENTPAQLVHISNYWKKDVKMDEEFLKIVFPASPLSYNSRKSNIMANVNLKDPGIRFDAQVTLSGQFSTMTRGVYLDNFIDPTIQKKYHEKFWEIAPNVTLLRDQVSIKSKEPPFTTVVSASYTSQDLISMSNDTISIGIHHWFKPIIPEYFDASARITTYYPDFFFKDSYTYLLKFSEPVRLVSSPKNQEFNTETAMMTFDVRQLDPTTIKIDSFLSIFANIPPDQSEILQSTVDFMNNLANNGELKFVRDH